MFRDAYSKRRCIVAVDGFSSGRRIKGKKAKEPHAIATKNGEPFGRMPLILTPEDYLRPLGEERDARDR
jgi:hypothetical protein